VHNKKPGADQKTLPVCDKPFQREVLFSRRCFSAPATTKTIKVKLKSYIIWPDTIPEAAPVPVFNFLRTFENYRIED
jgi:hypothetical protein